MSQYLELTIFNSLVQINATQLCLRFATVLWRRNKNQCHLSDGSSDTQKVLTLFLCGCPGIQSVFHFSGGVLSLLAFAVLSVTTLDYPGSGRSSCRFSSGQLVSEIYQCKLSVERGGNLVMCCLNLNFKQAHLDLTQGSCFIWGTRAFSKKPRTPPSPLGWQSARWNEPSLTAAISIADSGISCQNFAAISTCEMFTGQQGTKGHPKAKWSFKLGTAPHNKS